MIKVLDQFWIFAAHSNPWLNDDECSFAVTPQRRMWACFALSSRERGVWVGAPEQCQLS